MKISIVRITKQGMKRLEEVFSYHYVEKIDFISFKSLIIQYVEQQSLAVVEMILGTPSCSY